LRFNADLQYCVALVKCGNPKKAFDVLHDLSDANVYWHDQEKMVHMHVVGMSMAKASFQPSKVAKHCRWLIMHYPYASNTYRLYSAALCSGTQNRLAFASAQCQKFFKRVLQQRFGGTVRKHVTPKEVEELGSVPKGLFVKDEPEQIWSSKPILLTLYGHILSCASSYLPAIGMHMFYLV
jgi:hypothetical protein